MAPIRGFWALVLCATACSASTGDDAPPAVTLEQARGGGDLITIEADSRVDGRRPKLTLICEPGKPAAVRFDLVRPPATPPPERDIFAQMQVKGGPEVTIELAWLTGASWQVRIPHPSQPLFDTNDRNNQQRLLPVVHAFSRERKLTLRPPAAYAPEGDLVWDPQTFGPHLPRAQACASLDKVPDPGE